ncbi:MAG: NAD-dependent epimerase/dehydratase family protein [Limisphaerales bacterium]
MSARGKVLVTGGAGFIGSHLVERLLSDGKAVVVVDDLSTGRIENLSGVKNHAGLTFIQSKVSDCKDLNKIVSQCESVYHLAAAVGVELVIQSCVRSIETNIHETEVILHAVAENRVPVLLASTSEVYGKSTKPAFSEDDDLLIGPPKFSRWSYACSKLMDEFLALAFANERQVPVVVARLFNTVGPRQTGQYGMVLPRFIAAAKGGEPLRVYGDGRQTRCFCYVKDTVEALVRLQDCSASRNSVFNVGNPEEVSILELAKLVLEITKSKSQIEFVPYEKAYAPGFEDMLRRKPVIEQLVQTTGFRPATSLRRIVELTAESFA